MYGLLWKNWITKATNCQNEYTLLFVEEVNKLEQNNPTMGVLDTVIKYNRKEEEDREKLITKLTERFGF